MDREYITYKLHLTNFKCTSDVHEIITPVLLQNKVYDYFIFKKYIHKCGKIKITNKHIKIAVMITCT